MVARARALTALNRTTAASGHITIYVRCEIDLVGRICHDTMTTHGTKSAYNRGCRCDACREASRLARSRQRENARRREQRNVAEQSEAASAVPLQRSRNVEVEVLERHESAFGNGQTARAELFPNGPSPSHELSSSNGTFVQAEAAALPAPVIGDGIPGSTPQLTLQITTSQESHEPAPDVLEESFAHTSNEPAANGLHELAEALATEPPTDVAPEPAEDVPAEPAEDVAPEPVAEDEVEAEDLVADDTEMSPTEAIGAVESFVEAFDGVWNEVSGLLERNAPEPETPEPVVQEEPVTSFPLVEVQVRSSLLPPPPVPSSTPLADRHDPAIDEPRSSEDPVTEIASEPAQESSPAPSPPHEKRRSLFGGRRRASRTSSDDSGS